MSECSAYLQPSAFRRPRRWCCDVKGTLARAANVGKVCSADLHPSKVLHDARMAGLVKLHGGVEGDNERPVWAESDDFDLVDLFATSTPHQRAKAHLGLFLCAKTCEFLPMSAGFIGEIKGLSPKLLISSGFCFLCDVGS